jgi:transposase
VWQAWLPLCAQEEAHKAWALSLLELHLQGEELHGICAKSTAEESKGGGQQLQQAYEVDQLASRKQYQAGKVAEAQVIDGTPSVPSTGSTGGRVTDAANVRIDSKEALVMAKRTPVSVNVLSPSELAAKNLGPLVLANPILERMDIRRIVNLHCPGDQRLEIPVGDIIFALVANRLCSPEPLYHVGDWADYSGAEFLLGTPADALNDDRLARALDAVFPRRWEILADIALHVSKRFNVGLAKVHYDPTSFHFTGEYDEQSESPSLVPELKPFKIEVGRHAQPGDDIKEAQVGVNLANDGKGPIPFFYHSADGSANHHTAVAKNLQHMLKYVKPKRVIMVTDRGCFSAEHAVKIVKTHHFHFISSITWTEELANLYDKTKPAMKEASFLSLKEKRKRELGKPEETWERYSIAEIPYKITFENREEEESEDSSAKITKKVKRTKESIRARLVFVHSTADMKVCRKTRDKYTKRIREGLEQIQRSVENGYLKEEEAVIKKINLLYGKKQARNYFTYEVAKLTAKEIRSLPPRRRGQRKRSLKFSFQYHPEIAKKDAKYDGLYAICTSLPKKAYSTDNVFTSFKEQHHVETAHRKWKNPIRLRPLFLKTATRIESLILVQFLALMGFYLLQRCYRQAKGPSCRTTAETLLKRFALCGIGVRYTQRSVNVTPFALKQPQESVLKTLRFPHPQEQIRSHVALPSD